MREGEQTGLFQPRPPESLNLNPSVTAETLPTTPTVPPCHGPTDLVGVTAFRTILAFGFYTVTRITYGVCVCMYVCIL